jgi:hypothetical protein
MKAVYRIDITSTKHKPLTFQRGATQTIQNKTTSPNDTLKKGS